MNRSLSLLFTILILWSGVHLSAQRKLDFEKLSIKDGFTSSKANAIIQDRKGFIWIGTWNGLNRYDGYDCEIFRPSYHDSTTISNREVVDLLEDHEGNIWIGTSSGLNRLDPSTGVLKRYPFENRILSLLEDSDHFIWIGTQNEGLYRLDPATGNKDHFLPNECISDIYEDSRKILWVATYYGLVNFDRKTSGYIRYLPGGKKESSSISHQTITQITESKDGNLWVGTWGGGLNKIIVHPDKDSLRFENYLFDEKTGSLSSNVIYKLYYDDYDNLWIGTWDGGLILLKPDQQKRSADDIFFNVYKNDLSDTYSISGNNITALFVDRSGVLWLGSSKIDRTNILETGITRYKINHLVDGMYVENGVRTFAGQGENIWLGTSRELKLYRNIDNQFEFIKDINNLSYWHENTFYTANSVMSIISNKSGLWVGTEDAGLLFMPGETAIKKKKPDFLFFNRYTNPRIPGDKVCCLEQSKKDSSVIWIGTMQSGFAKVTYRNGKANVDTYPVGRNEKAYSDYNIRSIHEDKNGKVWIGTQNGLNCFDPEKQNFEKYFYSISDTNSINDNVINVIFEDHAGVLWIGTNSGLNKKQELKLPDGQFKIRFKGYPNIKYLNNEIINNILEDDANNLWLGLYRGIIQFNESDEEIVNECFTKEFQNVKIERNSDIRTEDGNIFLGGGNGFLSFRPDSLFKYSLPPKVCITDLQIFNISIDELASQKKRYRLNNSIPYSQSIDLSYKDDVITFVFSAMDYKNSKKNSYAYFLDGFDKQWNEVGARNTATYTSMPPGDYIFKVKAANSDGVWSKELATLNLHISTPWWKTIWAYIVYIIIIFGLLYFFKEYSIIEVKEKSRIVIEHIKNEEEQRLNELKAHFYTDITHEFRTPLTLILGPAKEIMAEKGLTPYVTKQTEMIQRNAHKLLRLVNQLMEFRKIEKGKMEVFLQKCDIIELMNSLYDSFKLMASSKNIDFSLEMKSPEIVAFIDCDKLEKVMYNLLSNAFKYSEDGGKISLWAGIDDIDTSGKSLVIKLKDTGIGIAEEHKSRVFERFFQANQKRTQSTGGIGLYLSKTLVEQHGGFIDLESELGKGSCFTVVLPAGQEGIVNINKLVKPDDNELNSVNDAIAAGNNQTLSVDENEKGMSPKILIVEDDSDLNEFLVSGMTSSFNVISAFNGKDGLDQARKHNPDIIITDIMMPEMDGFELCKMLRKDLATSHIPVVFLTAKTMKEDEIKGLKLGAVDYVYKPFNLLSLKLKIKNILENRKNIHDKMRVDQLIKPETIELSSLDESFLKDAVDAVNKYLDDSSFDVDKFSLEIGISANQAYRKIKALTGQTAKEFIRNQRLKTSATMLLQKKRSISEIIYMVGFSSPSYFTRCFKEFYGCTPKEYIDCNGNVDV